MSANGAPPAHPEVTGLWGWVELTDADGLTLVMDSGEWGEPYDRKKARGVSLDDLSKDDREKIKKMPDPAPLSMFDNVYAEPTALLRTEREQYAAYLDSFVSEEAAR